MDRGGLRQRVPTGTWPRAGGPAPHGGTHRGARPQRGVPVPASASSPWGDGDLGWPQQGARCHRGDITDGAGFIGVCQRVRGTGSTERRVSPSPPAGTHVPRLSPCLAMGSASRDGTRDGDVGPSALLCPGQGTAAGGKDDPWIFIFYIHVSNINPPGCSFPDNRIHYDGNILRRTAA